MSKRRRRRRQTKLMYMRLIFFLVILILTIFLVRGILARYRSSAKSGANLDLAYYVFSEGRISQELKLGSILPRREPYTYTFSVANNDGKNRTQVSLAYSIIIKTTTNLPLSYKVYNTEDTSTDLVQKTETSQDDDGTYFKYIYVQGDTFGFSKDEETTYQISVTFPEQYNLAEYENILEYVEISVDSKQRIQ